MKNVISKSVQEIKSEVGIYFKTNSFWNSFKDLEDEGYAYDFSCSWHNMFFRGFEESVNMIYNLVTCSYKKNPKVTIQIKEHLFIQYAKWFESEEKGIYYTLEDAKKSLHLQIVNDVEDFMFNNKKNHMLLTLQKKEKSLMKSLYLRSSLGKKVQYILDKMEALKNCKLEQLFNVEVLKEYENDQEQVLLPGNWDDIKNSANLNIIVVKKTDVFKSVMYLFKMSIKNNAMSLLFELDDRAPISNFQEYFLNEDKTNFCFDSNIFLDSETAIEYMQKEFDKQKEKMKVAKKKLEECL